MYWRTDGTLLADEDDFGCSKGGKAGHYPRSGWGGGITASPVPMMEALEIADYGMIGEGEITICEMADALEGKRDIHSVDGMIFKEGGEWVITSPRAEITDLDSLPYPDYEGFEYEQLLNKTATDILGMGKDRFGFLSLARSCPFNCTFCFHPSGSKYRRRSIESALREIDYLIECFDIHNIYITDELFLSRIEELRMFCKEIKKRNIGFVISLRVDRINREMLELLRDHGCLEICFGLESADDRILSSMNKKITVGQIDRALALCNEVGIKSQGNFIFGDEAETVETAENTLKWWQEHPQYPIRTTMIILYPGSILYQNACKKGIIKDEVQFIKDGCPLTNVSQMPDADYRNLALKLSMLPQTHTDVLEDASIRYIGNGKIDFTARCSECGKYNTWKTMEPFRVMSNIFCEHCGHMMHIVVAGSIGNVAKTNFQLLKEHKIAIWPMTNIVGEMHRAVPDIMEDNIYFIDSASMKVGAHFYDKAVQSPSVIAEQKIDTVFLTTSSVVALEIIEMLKEFPSVKNVFYAGDLFDPDFPKRVKKTH